MKESKSGFEHVSVLIHLLRWSWLVFPLAVVTGSVIALFLWLLERVTVTRMEHSWLLYLLPVAGVLIYLLYRKAGKNVESGNNLIIDEIHEPGGGVPARMAPLILATTVLTHLFGGSAGREGTAVQIGGSFAALYNRWIRLNRDDLRILLMTGVSAGFGAVFGTPLAGAVFALEVLHAGRIRHTALLPCLMSAVIADITCSAWGIRHTSYHISFSAGSARLTSFLHLDSVLLLKAAAAGIAFGLAGYVFTQLSHGIKRYANRWIPAKWLLPAIGGAIVILLTLALGTPDYLGLGVTSPDPGAVTIVSAFRPGGAGAFSWFWKMVFTAVTLGFGFKGGEVTPLFFIGATLGNILAVVMGAPVDLIAGLGFIAVFAGATNTPIACTLMGVELFGGENVLYYAVACFTAYYFSGNSGIYSSQGKGKFRL